MGISIGYCTMLRLYAVLETWGVLHNQQGGSPRWLCNIVRVSMNSIEPRHSAITNLDYGPKFVAPASQWNHCFVQQEVETEKCSYHRNLSQPMKPQLWARSVSSVSTEISTSQWNHCFASYQFKLVIASCYMLLWSLQWFRPLSSPALASCLPRTGVPKKEFLLGLGQPWEPDSLECDDEAIESVLIAASQHIDNLVTKLYS